MMSLSSIKMTTVIRVALFHGLVITIVEIGLLSFVENHVKLCRKSCKSFAYG